MSRIYDDADEEARHQSAIHALATEMHASVAEVQGLYESELTRLKSGARIKDFLPDFISRKVRRDLKSNRRPAS